MADFENPAPRTKERLLPFLDFFEDTTEPLYTENRTMGFHPYSYHEQVEDFIGQVYAAKLVQAFDWPSWQEEAQRYFDQPEAVASADLDTLIKLFTYHIRLERFTHGHLARVLDQGYFPVLIKRLQELNWT